MSARIADPYVNEGNPMVLLMVPPGTRRGLYVDCSGGEKAHRLHDITSGLQVVELTYSVQAANFARQKLDAVEVIDLEQGLTDAAMNTWHAPADLLLFFNLQEHLDDPVMVLRRRPNFFSRKTVMLARCWEAFA